MVSALPIIDHIELTFQNFLPVVVSPFHWFFLVLSVDNDLRRVFFRLKICADVSFLLYSYRYTLTLNVNLQSMSRVRLLGISGLPILRHFEWLYDMAARSSGWKAFTTRRVTGNPLGLNRSPNPTKTDEWIGLRPILEAGGNFFPLADGFRLREIAVRIRFLAPRCSWR